MYFDIIAEVSQTCLIFICNFFLIFSSCKQLLRAMDYHMCLSTNPKLQNSFD